MDRREAGLTTYLKRCAAGGVMLLAALGLAGCNTLAATFLKPDIDTAAASLPAGDYTLDPKHASLFFRINHLGYSTYIGRFERFEASLTGDPAQPEAAQVTAIVDMASLNVANPEFADQLMGPDWFDAARFPQASFRTYGLKIVGEKEADISGDLTMKGRTQAVIIRAKLNGSAYDHCAARMSSASPQPCRSAARPSASTSIPACWPMRSRSRSKRSLSGRRTAEGPEGGPAPGHAQGDAPAAPADLGFRRQRPVRPARQELHRLICRHTQQQRRAGLQAGEFRERYGQACQPRRENGRERALAGGCPGAAAGSGMGAAMPASASLTIRLPMKDSVCARKVSAAATAPAGGEIEAA